VARRARSFVVAVPRYDVFTGATALGSAASVVELGYSAVDRFAAERPVKQYLCLCKTTASHRLLSMTYSVETVYALSRPVVNGTSQVLYLNYVLLFFS
jgi:hypothetical protein